MFSEFDFSSLNSADAVREEIIDPILKRLGYGPDGQCRVTSGRALEDPFVMIGSTRQAIKVIPDYLGEPDRSRRIARH